MIEFIGWLYLVSIWDQIEFPSFMIEFIVRGSIVVYILVTLGGLWRLLEKADISGWWSIVPVYNVITIFKIINVYINNSELWLFLPLIPITLLAENANHWFGLFLVMSFLAPMIIVPILTIRIAKAFDKKGLWKWGLFGMPMITMSIMAFGSTDYKGFEAPKQKSTLFQKEEETQEKEEKEDWEDEWID